MMILLFHQENAPDIYNVGVGPAPVMAKLVYNPHEYYSYTIWYYNMLSVGSIINQSF
jgi:hypothetical protein